MNERSPNPYIPGSPPRKAWDEGYAAALSDMAGIEPKSKRGEPFGIPKFAFPR